MAIGPFTTERSGGDDRWMGSRHGVSNAHPGTLDAVAFASAAGVENGVVPSGYPLTKADDKFGPYDPEGTDDLYGFSIDDRDVSQGDALTAVLWHGRIKLTHLPIEMTAPADPGQFTFEDGE